ncbi:hypothetical protein [Actibacterium lipolyticum]|uniref:Uncharacterized protein n=1 Tax=Actibacterium lipolyticum TaxID=1524263 RepID=A0A238KWU4_9RHOB|nr:hypothetical protein [Actibacterium lipolyticum]SMX47187.1 hypothetical protein COL8621_03363 [Actibacterium lipolyticum]
MLTLLSNAMMIASRMDDPTFHNDLRHRNDPAKEEHRRKSARIWGLIAGLR